MGLFHLIKDAVMKMLNLKEIKKLGADLSSYMAEAIRTWDDLFYLINQPPHSLKLAQTITSYLATLATSELTLDAGAGQRGKYITEQAAGNLLPNINEAVQLAGAGGMAAIKPFVKGESVYVEIIPRSRIFPKGFGPNKRIESGFFTDFDRLKDGKPVVRIEEFALQEDGLLITNRAYRLKEADGIGSELSLSEVERWADLQARSFYFRCRPASLRPNPHADAEQYRRRTHPYQHLRKRRGQHYPAGQNLRAVSVGTGYRKAAHGIRPWRRGQGPDQRKARNPFS